MYYNLTLIGVKDYLKAEIRQDLQLSNPDRHPWARAFHLFSFIRLHNEIQLM